MRTRSHSPGRALLLAGCSLAAVAVLMASPRLQRPNGADPPIPALPLQTTNLQSARLAAKAAHKDILVEFLGPDSSDVPRPIDRQVSDEKLATAVADEFVFLRMGVNGQSPASQLAEVSMTAERLGVRRFPTFVLMDDDALPYARWEQVISDATSCLANLSSLKARRLHRDFAFARAAKAQGPARAKLLHEGLLAVHDFADSAYHDVECEIVRLDSNNSAGLRSRYETAVAQRQIDTVVQNEVYPLVDRHNFKAAVVRLERLMAELKPPAPQKQLVIALQGQLHYSGGDRAKAVTLLDEAIAIDPYSESAARVKAAKAQLVQQGSKRSQ